MLASVAAKVAAQMTMVQRGRKRRWKESERRCGKVMPVATVAVARRLKVLKGSLADGRMDAAACAGRKVCLLRLQCKRINVRARVCVQSAACSYV